MAEWQRKRAEEEAARLAALRNSGGGDEGGDGGGRTNAGRKAYQAMMQEKRMVGALQAEQNVKAAQVAKAELIAKNEDRSPLDMAKVNQLVQNNVDAARWAGMAAVEQARQESEKKNTGGKSLAVPVPQEPEPETSSWWDLLNPFWYFSDKPWPWENPTPTSTPTVLPTQTKFPTVVFTPTISVSPIVTPTPTQSTIYNIDGPMTVDQIPPEFICTLPEWKNINGQNLRNLYYDRCKIGEQLMVGLLTDPDGWWWKDNKTEYFNWEKNVWVVTPWEGVKTNEDFWRLALAYGLDTEGTTLRRDNVDGYGPLVEEAIINKFWHFDKEVTAQYGKPDASSGIPDPNDHSSLGTNGRLIALGSLESLQMRVNDPGGFVTQNQNASYSIVAPKDNFGNSTVMWEESWNRYADLFAKEPAPGWRPLPNAPYEIGNIGPNHPYYKSEKVAEGTGKFDVLYRSDPNAASVRAIVLTFEQFAVYSQYPK